MNYETNTFRNAGLNQFLNLVEKADKTTEAKFRDLLDKEINISKSVRSEASTSQNNLRDNLTSQSTRDKTFPRIMSLADKDFIGGSFARHTKIKPLDDIDIYFPIDGHGLTFTDDDGIQFSVFSDGVLTTNVILGSRWGDLGKVSSYKLISEFCKTLKSWYPNSIVKQNGQAVTVRLTSVAVQNQNDPGLGFDVVPCFYIKQTDPNQHNFYVIPDGKDGWIRTNPRVDTNVNETLHDYHNHFYRPIIKLVKYWNAVYFRGKISSYYIELVIARAFCTRGSPITSLQQGLFEAFSVLGKAILLEEKAYSWIAKAPAVEANELSKLDRYEAYGTAKIAEEAMKLFNEFKYTEALEKWRNIFKGLK